MAQEPRHPVSRQSDETSLLTSPVLWIAVAIVLSLGVGLYFWQRQATRQDRAAAEPAPPQQAPAPEASIGTPVPAPALEPQVRHPVPAAETAPEGKPEALPPLNESDKAVEQSLAGAFGEKRLDDLSLSDNLVRHIVASIDNLPRPHVSTRLFPLRRPPGRLATTGKDEAMVLSPKNYARYTRYVQLVQSVDTRKAVAVYLRFYPLFQQAYEELGYPDKYFNDRLIDVIDHLLDTPQAEEPLELVATGTFFQFADPDLEDLSAGRKLLLRIGPDHATVIKAKLRELRGELVRKSGAPAN